MVGAPSLSTVNVSNASFVGAGAGAETGSAATATGADATGADTTTGAAAGSAAIGFSVTHERLKSTASNAIAAAIASHHHFFDDAFSSTTILSSDLFTAVAVPPTVDGCSRCDDTAFICAATPDRKLPAPPRPSAVAIPSFKL